MPSAVEMWRDGIQRQAYLPGMPPAHGTQATSHRLGIPETSKRDPRPVTFPGPQNQDSSRWPTPTPRGHSRPTLRVFSPCLGTRVRPHVRGHGRRGSLPPSGQSHCHSAGALKTPTSSPCKLLWSISVTTGGDTESLLAPGGLKPDLCQQGRKG